MKKRITALLLAFVLVLGLLPAGVMADGDSETIGVSVDVTYGQSDARNMLEYINAFRLGQDVDGQQPDFWNEDNTTKTDLTGQLSPLTYDYALERTAMQRAAEIAVYYSHTRPDGSRCFTAWPDGFWYSQGENIAAGYGSYTTGYEVFVGWREDNDDYSGQGHRRNMLSPNFTRIGIGHVVYNGVHYWTQSFGNGPADDAAAEAAEDTRSMTVAVNTGSITQASLAASVESYDLESGESAALPAVTASFLMTETWPGNRTVQAGVDLAWTSEDSSIAAVEGGNVVAVAGGTTNITASFGGASVSVPVKVTGIVASGTCGAQGDNLVWKIDTNGVLTISGSGEMADYSEDYPGWYELQDSFSTVVIEPGATNIGAYAFYNCVSVTGVTIPDSVTSIDERAFIRCTALAEVTIPGSVTSIGEEAFSRCFSLQNAVLTNGLTYIGSQAFKYCEQLTGILLPETLNYIDDYAFSHCFSLNNVAIPAGVNELGSNPFAGCCSLTNLTVDQGNNWYTAVDGVLFSSDMTVLIGCPDTITGYTVPEGVTTIAQGAFSGTTSLTEITVPASVTSVEGYIAYEADMEVAALSEITFKGSAPQFDEETFIGVKATAYYPEEDPSWTADVRKNYAGEIEWAAVPHTHHYLETVTEPTCTEKGFTTYTCSICGDTYKEEIPALGHNPGEKVRENEIAAKCETAGSYDEVVYCTICNEELSRETKTIPATGHDWGEWTVTTPATCEAAGEETRTCSHDASHKETRTIAALGHDWGEWTVTTPATCNASGIETRTCKNDSDHAETRAIAALGHDWGEWVVTKPATCEETGLETRTCKNDSNHKETSVIAALGHTPGEIVRENEVAAKCETAGSYDEVVYCTRCNKELSRETKTIPALGHDWGTAGYCWTEDSSSVTAERTCKNDPSHVEKETVNTTATVIQEATCEEKGRTTYTAEFKNTAFTTQTRTVTDIDAKGHTPKAEPVIENVVEPTCLEAGSYDSVIVCAACGKELSRSKESVPALGHDWGDWAVTTAAACETAGEETRVCRHDASHKETRAIAALGHDWGDWVVTRPATELQEGEETRTCRHDANHKETRVIPVAGHVHKLSKVEAKAATCTETGNIEYYVCDTGENPCGRYFADADGRTEINLEATVTAALGHDWDEWTVTTPATCETAGEETRVCRHDEAHKETRAIAALGHDWGEWVVTKEPTETEEGEETRTCKHDANHKETRTIPVSGHEHKLTKIEAKAATCTEAGNIEYYICDKGGNPCGKYFADAAGKAEIAFEDTVTAALGHDWGEWIVTKEPTQTEEGEETRTCRHDPTHKETRPIDKLPADDPVLTERITLEPVGDIPTLGTVPMKATILPENATNKKILWSSSNEKVATVDENGVVTAKTYGKATITAETEDTGLKAEYEVQTRFHDVQKGVAGFTYVYWAADNGIVTGYDGIYFGPQENCTKVQLIMILYKMAGSPEAGTDIPFTDVTGNKTKKAVRWALDEGIINYGSKLNPDSYLTRAQIVLMLWKMAGEEIVDIQVPFTDVNGAKTLKAVKWALNSGITKGTSATTFSPEANCTRVQLVTFLNKFSKL